MGFSQKICRFLPLFLLHLGVVSTGYKRWVPNTNFENPSNWHVSSGVGRVPCQNDHVIFPASAPPVFVQTNTSILELVLPNNGEIVLGDFVSIGFPTSTDGDTSCQGADLRFIRTDPKNWFDPNNWCTTFDPEGDCLASQPELLDTERLPCQYDGTTFPTRSSFLVNLDTGVDVITSSLHLGGKAYTTGSFKTFLNSPEGKKQFVRSLGSALTTINVRGDTCSDISGCACGNDQGAIQEKVCAIQSPNCETLPCNRPIRPKGGCCDVCGAMLTLDYGGGFKKSTLDNLVQKTISPVSRNSGVAIKYVISKTSTDQIQVVLKDEGDGTAANEVAMTVNDKLKADMNGYGKYGVTDIRLERSASVGPSHAAQIDEGMTGGSIAGIIIAILLFLAVLGLAMFCLMDRRTDSTTLMSIKNSIKRLGKKQRSGTMELGPTVGYIDTDVTFGDPTKGFDNPMYDTAMMTNGVMIENGYSPTLEPPAATLTPQVWSAGAEGFDNPLYGQGPIQEAFSQDPSLRFNPVFLVDGLEDDSTI